MLLAEDDAEFREVLRDLLIYSGFGVQECADGGELLVAIADAPAPFVVVTDLWMPDMDAFEIVEELRREGVHEQIPVVVISGDAGFFDRAYPDVPFFSKPLDHDRLLRTLVRLGATARARQFGQASRLAAYRKKLQGRLRKHT